MRSIVHLSDIHCGRVNHLAISPLIATIARIAPDVVAVSGDLTQRARPDEFKDARAFLDRLPTPQIVVPGNHDVPLHNLAARLLHPLRRYRRYITDDLRPCYTDDEIAVLGVNTARSLTIKDGRINLEQVSWMSERFRACDPRVVKVVVTHHPFDLPDGHDERDLVRRAHGHGSARCVRSRSLPVGPPPRQSHLAERQSLRDRRPLRARGAGRNGCLGARSRRRECVQRPEDRVAGDHRRAVRVAAGARRVHGRAARGLSAHVRGLGPALGDRTNGLTTRAAAEGVRLRRRAYPFSRFSRRVALTAEASQPGANCRCGTGRSLHGWQERPIWRGPCSPLPPGAWRHENQGQTASADWVWPLLQPPSTSLMTTPARRALDVYSVVLPSKCSLSASALARVWWMTPSRWFGGA